MTNASWLDSLPRASPASEIAEVLREPQHATPRTSYFTELLRTAYGPQDDAAGTAILFTGIERGCGVSYISCCIAAELAERGGKVLLADAQAIAAMIGVPRPDSLSERSAESFCERVRPGRVWVLGMKQLTIEGLPTSPVGVTAAAVLRSLQSEFSHLVIDAPAIHESNLALSLSSSVQGVVFVARAGHTESHKLCEARRKFTSFGARVLGSVYNAR